MLPIPREFRFRVPGMVELTLVVLAARFGVEMVIKSSESISTRSQCC